MVSGTQSKVGRNAMSRYRFLFRYGLRIPLDDSEDCIEKAILSSSVLFKIKFREQWDKHLCNIDGCGQFLISDGGMKIHR